MPIQTKQQPPYYSPTTKIIKTLKGTIQSPAAAGQIPTFTLMQNDIGTITWTVVTPGQYNGTLTGAFPLGKVYNIPGGNGQTVSLPIGSSTLLDYSYNIQRINDNQIQLSIYDTTNFGYIDLFDVGTSGEGEGLPFEINIYQ